MVKPVISRGLGSALRLAGDKLTGALSILAILAVWQAAVLVFHVQPFVLPAPTDVVARIVGDLVSGEILQPLLVTTVETLLGFACAAVLGLVLGVGIALVPFLEKALYPPVLALQTVPKVAIAPLLIIWFGFGIQSKVLTAALIGFFPVVVNVIAGLRSVDPKRLMLMRALRVYPGSLCFLAEFSDHKPDGCQAEECQGLAVAALPILGQPAAAVEPGDGPLNDPPLWQHGEPFHHV